MAETTIAIQATECEGPDCRELVSQQPGGHRRRRYCSDDCKQRAYRDRQKEKKQRELREGWADLSEETQGFLEWVMSRNDDRLDFVKGIEETIRRERGEPTLSEEEAIAQARLHCYLGNNWYLESTQRVFVELIRVHGHAMASKVRTAINAECGNQRQAMSLLPPVDEPVDERYQQYGQWLLECGKRLKYHPLSLNVYKERCPGLFGGETDIYDIEGDQSHWEAAAYSFSAEGQLIAIAHAHQAELLDRLLEQERKNAAEQAFQYNVRLADAQRVQQALTTEQGKVGRLEQTLIEERAKFKSLLNDFMQAGKKIANLERDVQRFERMKVLKSRESMLQELMLLGGRLKYTSMTDLGISEGIDHWLNYVRGASDEDLAKAIAHGYHQADSLAMAAIEASDLQTEVRMRQRIDDLEQDVMSRDARIAELEYGQIEEVEPGDALSPEQIQALVYHAREHQVILERQAQQVTELEREVREKITKIHKLEESHGSTMFTMNSLLAAAQSALREETVSEQQLATDLNAVLINVASEALLQTPYGQALQAVAEREREVAHLKTRISKQYERRIDKQQKRIEELEQALQQQQVEGDETGSDQQSNLLQRVNELEETLDLERRGSEGVQRRFRDFVRLTHERQARSQDEKPSREELVARLIVAGERLNHCSLLVAGVGAGAESWQLFAEQATDEQLSEAVGMAEHYYENLCYLDELEQRGREAARDKQQQPKRVEALESELARYRQICDLSERQRLEEQWMDIGSQIRYRRCIPVDDRLAVGDGEEAWRAFKEFENDDRLASGIARVRRYAEHLVAGELEAQLVQAQRRVAELERQAQEQSAVS